MQPPAYVVKGRENPQILKCTLKAKKFGKRSTYPSVFWNWAPESMDMHPAPPPNP